MIRRAGALGALLASAVLALAAEPPDAPTPGWVASGNEHRPLLPSGDVVLTALPHAEGEILVRFKDGIGQSAKTTASGASVLRLRALVSSLLLIGLVTLPSQVPSSPHGFPQVSQAAPPPPAPVPPNASRITATVLKHSDQPLASAAPSVPADQPLTVLTLEIHTADPETSELASLARPGAVIEALSAERLASPIVGKKIRATLKLTGDASGLRWLISNVRPH